MPRFFLLLGAVPLVLLGVLALAGAREHVGVVTTGAGDGAWLGAAWVVAWLLSVVATPIAAITAIVCALLGKRVP